MVYFLGRSTGRMVGEKFFKDPGSRWVGGPPPFFLSLSQLLKAFPFLPNVRRIMIHLYSNIATCRIGQGNSGANTTSKGIVINAPK